ncbi:MAG: two component transcriptional regulator, LuxR family [Bacteroidetes bacterium]|nr:two component transcriptional regulator, LuxR family [Bacteroidota bacterium]
MEILIVDDSPEMRALVRDYVRALRPHAKIRTSPNAETALAEIGRKSPDIVLMDIRMDGMDGLEATRAITQQYPGIRVVIVTQYADRVLRDEAIAAGAVGFVSKSSLQDLSVHIV